MLGIKRSGLSERGTGESENRTAQDKAAVALQARVTELVEEVEVLRGRHDVSDTLIEKFLRERQRMEGELRELKFQRKKLEILVAYLYDGGSKDSLTQLLIRGAFLETVAKIREEMAKEEKSPGQIKKNCAVMIIDIDRFKLINDTYGHSVGDEALRALVGKLREIVRVTDVIGRWGGEEFVVFFPGAEVEEIYKKFVIDEDGFARIKVSFEPKGLGKSIEFTVSGGIALVVPDDDLQVKIDRADKALYKAKAAGRNQILKVVEE